MDALAAAHVIYESCTEAIELQLEQSEATVAKLELDATSYKVKIEQCAHLSFTSNLVADDVAGFRKRSQPSKLPARR